MSGPHDTSSRAPTALEREEQAHKEQSKRLKKTRHVIALYCALGPKEQAYVKSIIVDQCG